MSKELTEQWLNGTLPSGWYYLRLEPNFENRYDVVYNFGIEFDLYNKEDIEEVLAPVPDYHSLCELKQELEICKEGKADLYAKLCNALMQLEEANKLIGMIGCQTKNEDLKKCIDYCKKWGVE